MSGSQDKAKEGDESSSSKERRRRDKEEGGVSTKRSKSKSRSKSDKSVATSRSHKSHKSTGSSGSGGHSSKKEKDKDKEKEKEKGKDKEKEKGGNEEPPSSSRKKREKKDGNSDAALKPQSMKIRPSRSRSFSHKKNMEFPASFNALLDGKDANEEESSRSSAPSRGKGIGRSQSFNTDGNATRKPVSRRKKPEEDAASAKSSRPSPLKKTPSSKPGLPPVPRPEERGRATRGEGRSAKPKRSRSQPPANAAQIMKEIPAMTPQALREYIQGKRALPHEEPDLVKNPQAASPVNPNTLREMLDIKPKADGKFRETTAYDDDSSMIEGNVKPKTPATDAEGRYKEATVYDDDSSMIVDPDKLAKPKVANVPLLQAPKGRNALNRYGGGAPKQKNLLASAGAPRRTMSSGGLNKFLEGGRPAAATAPSPAAAPPNTLDGFLQK